jgi:hypothetical protein
MRSKKLKVLESWVHQQAAIHHKLFLTASGHKYLEDDDNDLSHFHGGQATAFELVAEKITELWK